MTTKVPVELSSTPSIVDNGDATAITIDSSELVGVGTTSPVTHLHLESSAATQFRIRTTSSSSEPQMIMIDGAGDYFAMQKVDRGMTFKPQGAEEVRIDADGLKFNGDTAAANALDDYEEGTFSPTITTESGASGQSYDRQYGFYTKIGDFVFLTFDVRITTVGTLSGSYLTLGGHGFTFEATNAGGMGLCGWFGSIGNLTTNQVNFYSNSNDIFLMQGGSSYLTPSGSHLTTNSRLIGGFCGQINR